MAGKSEAGRVGCRGDDLGLVGVHGRHVDCGVENPVTYDQAFYQQQNPIALESARAMLPAVLVFTGARSVVDVGCGVGAWASVAKNEGCTVRGVDGNVPVDQLLLEAREFVRGDLTAGYPCSGFDLAVCLEVAEHLPESSAPALVGGLCRAEWVLFSGAHPGQGGVDHQNERWGTWWERLFEDRGYLGSSMLKWRFWDDRRIQDYYLENVLLFASEKTWWRAGYDRSDLGAVDVIHPVRTGLWR